MSEETKQRSTRQSLQLLLHHVTGSRLLYLCAVCALGVATAVNVVSPLVVRFTIDGVIGKKPVEGIPARLQQIITDLGGTSYLAQHLWLMGIVIVALAAAGGTFAFLKGWLAARASESVARNIREKVYDHLQHLPFSYHARAETGDLIQRCTSDVETVRRFLAVQLVEVGHAAIMVAMALPVMLRLSGTMTVVVMAAVPFLLGFALYFFMKVKAAFKKSDEAEGAMSSVLQENITGVRVVRAFARQRFETDKFAKKNETFRDLTYRLIWLMAWYWSISDLVSLAQIAAVVIFGSIQAAAGNITLGTFMVFTTYTGMLLWPVRQMGRILTDMGRTFVSIGRLQDILDEPREDRQRKGLEPEVKGAIEYKNVSFGYNNETPVLKDVSFKVEPGETVAILGTTGSGKSSLVQLLPGLYDPTGGQILLDGQDITAMDRGTLRRQVGIVLQEPYLFSRSVRDNIALARQDALEEEIYHAAQLASVHDVIEEFEKGYDTAVGEKGVTLSGGQKQRVAMSRTLIQDCRVRIFDDSLSAVDTDTDAKIQGRLREADNRVTTFIISHRTTTLARADRILVLEEGKLVQNGPHAQLIKEPGLYRRIWNIQHALEEELEHETEQEVQK